MKDSRQGNAPMSNFASVYEGNERECAQVVRWCRGSRMGARNEALSLSLFLSLNSSTRKLPILQMGNKTIISCSTHTRTFLVPMILQRSHTSFLELLQAGRHRVVRLLATLLATAPLALVRAEAPRTPCIGSSGAGAGSAPRHRTPCTGSFGAGAGRGPRPRTPCICS